MKITTLLLGIALCASQITPLVCMDIEGVKVVCTECIEGIEDTEFRSYLKKYRCIDFHLEHFTLTVGVSTNKPYDVSEIAMSLLEQRKYVSSIRVMNPHSVEGLRLNQVFIQLHDIFFTKLNKYLGYDDAMIEEVAKYNGPINWIMLQTSAYNREVEKIIEKFITNHNARKLSDMLREQGK